MKLLVSLHHGYGLGDAVQMSAVLRHVKKHRPHWSVDFQAERGREKVGRGLVANAFVYGTPYPSERYDAEIQMALYDTWCGWSDRPNTRVEQCLRERFDVPWDPECAQYSVYVDDAIARGMYFLSLPFARYKHLVALHYQGDSAPGKKDLSHEQAARICTAIRKLGYVPLLVDWRGKSPLQERASTGRAPFKSEWGADTEYNTALIQQCKAFVGVDSGPAKCASATDVPSLVVWTGHHPAPYHDPAPNTTHLVPEGFHSMHPVNGDRAVAAWFDAHYKCMTYYSDPVLGVEAWLKSSLGSS